ncbi:precorrin-6A reductase [Butyrivibrio fibrisolvens]|uniref:precorrin-6A reductase n=1 Tax=Pseudobutyrivibrio ruminis TaxID=46206 RepID=UPI00040F0F9C|nr:precorrin-6A reductase [Pseudobutyrivibrio ruminis]MDC7277966.1 precorrin-6A reductase [Butyrivibrio fibrisolvens]
MKKVIIFGGTTEGRKLAETLEAAEINCVYCVATEYGKEPVKESSYIKIHSGRLDAEGMVSLYESEKPDAIVDATHPFAEIVKKEIETSLFKYQAVRFLRLARDEEQIDYSNCTFFDSVQECAKALKETAGNIFLTTGSKELPVFCEDESVRERIIARIIPNDESLEICKQQGLKGNQIVAMQGPFSKGMNIACLKEFNADICVLKESGKSGGEANRIEAANACGTKCFVIRRPQENASAMTFKQVVEAIFKEFGIEKSPEPVLEKITADSITADKKIVVSLAGFGMGFGTVTAEVKQAVAEADYLFGAPRMLLGLESDAKKYPYYLAKDILPCMEEIADSIQFGKKKAVVLFSGDTGFYSGATKLAEALKQTGYIDVKILPGISSINAVAAKANLTWQDGHFLSAHGISEDKWRPALIDAVQHRDNTFVITSGSKDVRDIGDILLALEQADKGKYRVFIGTNLYSDEKTGWYSSEKCSTYNHDGLSTIIIQNQKPTPKVLAPELSDNDYIRDKVPMSKEEIRQLSICKLHLHKDAVVYDIGSGSGSVAVEMARMAPGIKVYAIELKDEACQLIRKNVDKFMLENVNVISGIAPDALENLPVPTHVFIGGSGGRLEDIIEKLKGYNSPIRIVINAVTIETISEINSVLKKYEIENADVIQVTVSKAKKAGDYSIMQGQNPVYIAAFEL